MPCPYNLLYPVPYSRHGTGLILTTKQHHHDRISDIADELILMDVTETVEVEHRRMGTDVCEVEVDVLLYLTGIALWTAFAERLMAVGQLQQVADQAVAHVLDGSLNAHGQNL